MTTHAQSINSWERLLGKQPPQTAACTHKSAAPKRRPEGAADEEPKCREAEAPARPYGLTRTELEVLNVLAEGACNAKIAQRRGCAIDTVKVHLGRIYHKLGVQNRGEAIVLARRLHAVQQALVDGACRAPFRLEWIVSHISAVSFPAGRVLFRKGDSADGLYYVQSGFVSLPEVGATLTDGSVFGEIGIFGERGQRTASARCDTPVRLFRLDVEKVRSIYVENPSFAMHLIRLAADHASRELPAEDRRP